MVQLNTGMLDKHISRKTFLTVLSTFFLAGFLYLWKQVLDSSDGKNTDKKERRIKNRPMKGVTFYDEFFFYYSEAGSEPKVFSTKCTHAGCRISQVENNEVICSCHGSRFDASTGKPLKGPAYIPLQKLQFNLDQGNQEWIIQLSED